MEKLTDEQRNAANLAMRQQPWYQEWFHVRGLNPNVVKLSSDQQHSLAQAAAAHGVPFTDGTHIDQAGNINTKHGFAALPTWAKIAIAAAPIAATAGFGAAGIGPLAGTLGGSTSAVGGGLSASTAAGAVPLTTYGTGMAAVAPSLVGATGVTAGVSATAPSLMSHIANLSKNPLLNTAGRMLGKVADTSAANRGTTIDATMAHDELGLQAAAARRAAESDAYRKTLYGQLAAGYQPSARPSGVPSREPNGGYITDQARTAGQMLTDTSMAHMRTQDYPSITPLSNLPMKPGLMEQIANYASPALSLFDPRLYDQNGRPKANV